MSNHCCGPTYARDFFQGVRAAAHDAHVISKYLISCIDHEIDILGVDFSNTVGVTFKSDDGGLVTDFIDRTLLPVRHDLRAYKWLGDMPIGFIQAGTGIEGDFGGPGADPSFFAAIVELRDRQDEDSRKYALTSREFYARSVGFRGDDDVAEGTIRDGRIYHKLKDGDIMPASCVCCTWDDETGNCNGTWCPE